MQQGICKECLRKRNRQWLRLHYGERRKYHRNYSERLRQEVFSLLGGAKCSRCGFSDIRALQIDHINGRGAYKERRRLGGPRFYRQIIKDYQNGKKGDYQILCANCNWIKRHERLEWRSPVII